MRIISKLFLISSLFLFTPACSQRTELPSIFDNPVAAPGKTPKKSAKVSFYKLKLPSVDATFKELQTLDGRIVRTRNNLKKSRKSVYSLKNGDIKSLRKEVGRLVANGTIRVTKKNNLPSLSYNKEKGNTRSLTVFQSAKNMERTLRTAKTDLPAMQKDLQRLKKKTKRAVKKAPNEVQKAISTGVLKPTQLNNTMLNTRSNLKQVRCFVIYFVKLN
jgi:hypothetical protein